MERLRPLVLLTTDFKPNTGGIAEYLHHLCEGATPDSPVVVYSTVRSGGAPWPHTYALRVIPSPGQRLVGTMWGDGVPILRRLNTGRYFLRQRRFARRLVHRVLSEHGADADVFVGLWGLESHFWCAELRRVGVRYSLFAYGAEATAPFYGHMPKWRAQDFSGAHSVIGCSQGTADVIQARLAPPRAPLVLHPGITARAAERPRDLPGLGMGAKAENDLLLLTVARLVPRKGVDLVIRRVAELAAEFSGLRYAVVGDGPERAALDSLATQLGIRDRVLFLGAVDDATRNGLYVACDLFVTLNRELDGSDFEGFGIVFLEAGLAEKAVVGGRNGGVPDAIAHGHTGLLVDPEDAGESREAIRSLLTDAARRQAMGRAGRTRALESFSWDAATRRFAAIRRQGFNDG